MAPSVNLADDVAELSRAVGQLARIALTGRSLSQMEKSAAAAGLSAEQARMFWRGETLLPPRQSVALANAVLEQARAGQVNYWAQLRKPHAGSDSESASYAGKTVEHVTLPRGGTEDVVRLLGGPPETTRDDVTSTLQRLAQDWPSWEFEARGQGTLGTGKPKLVWSAVSGAHGRVSGATSLELAGKVSGHETAAAADARRAEQFMR
jgi:hypothetical protein